MTINRPKDAEGAGRFQAEHRMLQASWDKLGDVHLDEYLVSGLEDPRIHPQSILTRAFLADLLWPRQFNELIEAELRFGLVQSWVLQQLQSGLDRTALLHRIARPDNDSCPEMVSQTYRWLQSEKCPVPDYITNALMSVNRDLPELLLFEPALDTFCILWRAELDGRSAEPAQVLEAACGSANDYRFLHEYGLAQHIRYAGFDLVERNIGNAKRRFPDAAFFVGSLLEAALADETTDYLIVHDLFEHLSLDAMEYALSEVMRITRKEAWLHFFNAADLPQHQVKPVESYHWNTLSIAQLEATLQGHGGRTEVIRLAPWLQQKFGCDAYHNQEAVTLIASKES